MVSQTGIEFAVLLPLSPGFRIIDMHHHSGLFSSEHEQRGAAWEWPWKSIPASPAGSFKCKFIGLSNDSSSKLKFRSADAPLLMVMVHLRRLRSWKCH